VIGRFFILTKGKETKKIVRKKERRKRKSERKKNGRPTNRRKKIKRTPRRPSATRRKFVAEESYNIGGAHRLRKPKGPVQWLFILIYYGGLLIITLNLKNRYI
jgi:hypothetical protein